MTGSKLRSETEGLRQENIKVIGEVGSVSTI